MAPVESNVDMFFGIQIGTSHKKCNCWGLQQQSWSCDLFLQRCWLLVLVRSGDAAVGKWEHHSAREFVVFLIEFEPGRDEFGTLLCFLWNSSGGFMDGIPLNFIHIFVLFCSTRCCTLLHHILCHPYNILVHGQSCSDGPQASSMVSARGHRWALGAPWSACCVQ